MFTLHILLGSFRGFAIIELGGQVIQHCLELLIMCLRDRKILPDMFFWKGLAILFNIANSGTVLGVLHCLVVYGAWASFNFSVGYRKDLGHM